MTDINKQIEEEAEMIAREGVENILSEKNHVDKMKLHSAIKMTYKIGYKSALNNSRWRKVSDELPKVASKPYCIVARDDDGGVHLEWILGGYDEGVISFLLDKYVEWKPID